MKRECWWCHRLSPMADLVLFHTVWECRDALECRLRMRRAMRKQEARR